MASFKLTCKIETEEKGVHETDLYLKDVKDSDEAERIAKYHFICDKNVPFYGVTKSVEM